MTSRAILNNWPLGAGQPSGVSVPVVIPTPTPSPTLNALTVSNGSGTVGSAFTSTISGRTAGSTLSLAGAGAPGLSISGTTISGTPTTAGAVDVVETLAGATNSPRTTSGAITVAANQAVDIILLMGTSEVVGVSDYEAQDTYAANAFQYTSNPTDTGYRTVNQNLPISQAIDRNAQPSQQALSIGLSFINRWSQAFNVKTVVVGQGFNGTNLASAGHRWQVGDDLHEGAIAAVNYAIANIPGARIAAILMWDGGAANDANSIANGGSATKASWKAARIAANRDLRSRITGGANVPIILGGLVPEQIASYNAQGTAAYQSAQQLTDAAREIAVEEPNTYFFSPPAGYSGDNLHLLNAGLRIAGPRAANLLIAPPDPVIQIPQTGTVADGSPVAITLTCSTADPVFKMVGANAADWEIIRTFGTGGTGNINSTIATFTLRLAGNASTNYATKPNLSGTVQVTDGAGKVTQLPFTRAVAQPYGVGDQGPITQQYVGTYAKSTDGSIQSGTQQFAIPNCPAGMLIVEAFSSGGNADVTSVAIGGTQEKFQSVRGNANGGGSLHGVVNAQAGNITLDVVLGGGNGLAVDLTIQVYALTGTKATPDTITRIEPTTRNPPFETAVLTCPTNGVIFACGQCTKAARTAPLATELSGPPGDRFGMYRTDNGKLGYTLNQAAYSYLIALTFSKSV